MKLLFNSMAVKIFILPWAMILSSGCLATRQEIEDLRVDIVRLHGALQKVETRQEDSQVTMSSSQTALHGSQADLMSEFSSLRQKIDALSSRMDELGTQTSAYAMHLDDLDKNISNRLDIFSQAVIEKKQIPDPPPSALFNIAYNDYNRQRYRQSLKGFKAYLKNYGDTLKSAEARFYIGQSYFAQKKWEEAVVAFDEVLIKNSTSTIIPTAHLQKAQSLQKGGKTQEAMLLYSRIIQKYPHRKEAKTAKVFLAVLKKFHTPSAPSKKKEP